MNGKVYIGQTKYTIEHRFKEHVYKALHPTQHTKLQNAMRKYGVESFVIEPIEECDEDYLNDREIFWIAYYDSVELGYNISHGGEGVTIYSDKQILDAWNAGCTMRGISKAIGIKAEMAGKRLNALGISREEIDERARQATIERLHKPVYQYGLDGKFIAEYPSVEAAESKYDSSAISPAALGKNKTSCGFQWRYFKTNKIDPYITNNCGVKKAVHQYSLNGNYICSYDSATSAASEIRQDVSNICSACKGEQRSCGGFQWSYEKHEKIAPVRKGKITIKRPVVQYSLDGVFIASYDSATAASKSTGTRLSSITSVCNGKFKSAGGYIWKFETVEKEVAA